MSNEGIEQLLKQTGAWLTPGDESAIAVSSRIRLARNLADTPFPGWAGEDECTRIWGDLVPVLEALPQVDHPYTMQMSDVDDLDRQVLFERHLISREQAERRGGSGVVASRDEHLAVMVNEEDHLRIQYMMPGMALMQIWEKINAVDDSIESNVSYAYSPTLGYLTACPTNIGTAMRASVMLHLPGLVLMNEINPIIKGMNKIGLAVRGLWGEGTEAVGNMFQVSNQISMGEREMSIIENLEQIILEIVEHEKNARERLVDKRGVLLQDHVGRAYGVLSHAHILSSKEALDLLSGLRLGIDLGILNNMDKKTVDELLLLTQPGHLQKIIGEELRPKQRDISRAELIRKKIRRESEK